MRRFLGPTLATIALAALLLHKSESPTILGGYSRRYAVLLFLLAVNVALLWRRALFVPAPETRALRPSPSQLPALAVALLIPALFGAYFHTGASNLSPSEWVSLLLLSAIPFQLESVRGWRSTPPATWVTLALSAVFLVGTGMRLMAINYGLPHLYWDEVVFVNIAGEMIATHDLNPHWFGHPGSTTIYILTALYAVLYRLGSALGFLDHPTDFRTFFFLHPTLFYLSGRLLIAIVGSTTVLLTYRIASRLFNPVTGLVAAAVLSLSPQHVLSSKIIRTDILVTFLILLVFWFSLDILKRRTRSSYAMAGLFTGLAVATKYPAAVMIVTIALAHLLSGRWEWRRVSMLGLYAAAAIAGFVLASPFWFTDFHTTLADMAHEMRATPLCGFGSKAGLLGNLRWYLGGSLARGLGMIGLGLAGVGLLLCGVSRFRDRWLLASVPMFFLIFLGLQDARQPHWSLPALPFLCVLVAHAIYSMGRWIGSRLGSRAGAWVVLVFVMGIAVPLARASLSQGHWLSLPDTRTVASQWIVEHIPAGSRLLLENGTPQLPEEAYHYFVVGEVWEDREGDLIDTAVPEVRRTGLSAPARAYAWKGIKGATFVPYGHIGRLNDPEAVRRAGIEYMVLSDAYEAYRAESKRQAECTQIVETYERVMSTGTKIYELPPVPGRMVGSTIRVYRFDRNVGDQQAIEAGRNILSDGRGR